MRTSLYFLLLNLAVAGCNADPKEAAGPDGETASTMGENPPAAAEAAAADPELVMLSAAEQQAAGLQTGHVASRPMGTGLAVTGILDVPPEITVAITAPLGGFVESTELLQGTRVRKGQALAVVRNLGFVQLQQDYLETRARLEYARTELARQKELYEQEVAPQKNYQRAQADYHTLRVQTQAQADRLRLAGLPVGGRMVSTATLRAPRAGFVKTVNVTVGQAVTATETLFEIVDPDHLHVELTVFEKDVSKVRKDQLIRFTLPSDSARGGPERTARVHLIAQTIGADRTVRVHGHLDRENDRALLPGLYVRATIETGRTAVTALPNAALVRFEGQTYGFVAEAAGRYRRVALPSGRSEDGYTEVILPAGLSAATAFVTEGAYSLLAKMKNAPEGE